MWSSELYATIVEILTEGSQILCTESGESLITESPETSWTEQSDPTTNWTSDL